MEENQKKDQVNALKKRDAANDYVTQLRGQIVQGAEKKRYGELMTEHERMVNDKDIKSYERMDLNMYSKLPGFGNGYDRQRQMIERSVGITN